MKLENLPRANEINKVLSKLQTLIANLKDDRMYVALFDAYSKDAFLSINPYSSYDSTSYKTIVEKFIFEMIQKIEEQKATLLQELETL